MTDPRAYVDHEADARILSSKHPLGYAFLSRKELSLGRLGLPGMSV